jgi:uncharacterized protein YndB with AHSA1/START domain
MTAFQTSREIAATADEVFAAFSHPERLARWWGPAGFSNTFAVCEFKAGGRWSFTMHGPDGSNHPNECVFAEIDAPKCIVINHVNQPMFRLTITLEPTATGTRVSWSQDFGDAELARKIEHIVVPSNEQNLDRLAAEVGRA